MLPDDIADRLYRVHREPGAWFVAQFLDYVLRYQPETLAMLDDRASEVGVGEETTVGIHVRRTDKLIREAKYHDLEQYMEQVKQYYDRLARKQGAEVTRRVYLASDDPTVLDEARKKYPDYEILGDERVVQAASVRKRYTDDGLDGIMSDTYILSKCDLVVCTFSSNICRLIYEMQVARDPMRSQPVKSIDKRYYLV